MDTSMQTMENLFLQLGLNNSEQAIAEFISVHKLAKETTLEQASFWNTSQAQFIKECLDLDSDWAEVVDQLNVQLHE
tara:strand:- start:144218 stop:144448 length:231 start_codon:yes stop_codon:yes gene_type:complete